MRSFASFTPLKYLSLITGLLISFNLSSRSQTPVDSLKSKFEAHSQKSFQEKLFLHVDKSFYMTGDILWFKAYVVDGSSHKPADLSKVAYVELLDTMNHSVLQAKTSLAKGMGNGSMVLPASLSSGNYKIRAYTSWMRNFSPEYFFEEFISIINPAKRLEQNNTAKAESVDIRFFPEGGNLVNNLNSKVAFKVVGADPKNPDLTGSIIDQHNDTVASFRSFKNGMGSFHLNPQSGKTYRAVVYINHKKFIRDLPKAYSSGYVMSLTTANPRNLELKVSAGGISSPGNIYLLIHTRQVIKHASTGYLSNNEVLFNIPKDLLGEGISHLTIFDSDRRPVCERLYFKSPESKLLLQASVSRKQFAAREKVEIDLSSSDQHRKAVPANVSVAVYRLSSLPSFRHASIEANLWLTSDLTGDIENAADYFDPANTDSEQALDNLMLTQGWRRFNWDEALKADKAFDFLPEYQGHIVTGKLTNKETGAPAPGISTFLSLTDKRIQFYHDKSDEQGKLLFFTKDLYNRNELILQNDYAIDSLYQAEIFSPFSDRYSTQKIPPLRLMASDSNELAIHSINMQLPHLYSTGSKQVFIPKMDTTAFFGQPDLSYELDDYTRFVTMEEVLKEYIPQVALQRKQKRSHIKMVYSYQKGLYDKDALLLIDGVPFFDADKIVAFDPLKVKTIELVNHRYLFGELVSDGIINFKTYKNDLAGFDLDPRALVLDYEGLQLKREFYSPVYQTPEQIASRLPDFRELLDWSPDVQTDASGKSKLSFYTSDQKGDYIMVIQGITENGLAGSTAEQFTVK